MECDNIYAPGPSVAPLPFVPPPLQHTVHWFRKGLRLNDNPALSESVVNATTYRCVFVIEPSMVKSGNMGVNKWRFLLQSLHDLDVSLKKLGSRLFVLRGQAEDVLLKQFQEWGTTCLSFEFDPEPYARSRDQMFINHCQRNGIKCICRVSHTLYDLDGLIESNGGHIPLTYVQFQSLIAVTVPPATPKRPITVETLNRTITPLCADHDNKFGLPNHKELGFETSSPQSSTFKGGESEALARLKRYVESKALAVGNGWPTLTSVTLYDDFTVLSPYLCFGCLSPRMIFYQLAHMFQQIKSVHPTLSFYDEILRREFFYCAATRNINFGQMVGNPICMQIPWKKNDIALARWTNAQTGFPWIDAAMIKLRREGWICNLARLSLICFLTRGDLWISWEEGMKVFEKLLLDVDWSTNAGLWMWLSGSAFWEQFLDYFNPVQFGRDIDPNGNFIRHYIPALRNMPSCFIHQPWMAPRHSQISAKAVIGRDYPKPMVDHLKVSQINTERLKLVFKRLAQGHLNPIVVQNPSGTKAPPTCTSVRANVRSDEQCSTSHNPPEPSALITNDLLTFKRPSLHRAQKIRRLPKKQRKLSILPTIREDAINTSHTPSNLHQSRPSMPTQESSKAAATYFLPPPQPQRPGLVYSWRQDFLQ